MNRRILFWLLTACILLSGCSMLQPKSTDEIVFYYLEKEYDYSHSSVIAAEKRDSAGHRENLSYIMALYLMGPVEEEHKMPLPPGTRIYVKEQSESGIHLELSEASVSLSDSEFSLACACLAMTCFDISDTEKVTITNGDRSITMNRNSLLLKDDSVAVSATEETQ